METNYENIKSVDSFECIFPSFDGSDYDPIKFESILGDYVAEALIECQNESEMIEFNTKLKDELINWINCSAEDPWNQSGRDSDISLFVGVALKMIAGNEEFKQSDEFVDTLLDYAGKIAPFHKEQVKDLMTLTGIDISDKADLKMTELFERLGQKRKTNGLYSLPIIGNLFKRPEDDIDRLYQISGLNILYPNEEVFAQSQDLAKMYLENIVECMYREYIVERNEAKPTLTNLIELNKTQQQEFANIRRLNPVLVVEVMQLGDYLSDNIDGWLAELDTKERDYKDSISGEDGDWN
jgi:hypothetical protein